MCIFILHKIFTTLVHCFPPFSLACERTCTMFISLNFQFIDKETDPSDGLRHITVMKSTIRLSMLLVHRRKLYWAKTAFKSCHVTTKKNCLKWLNKNAIHFITTLTRAGSLVICFVSVGFDRFSELPWCCFSPLPLVFLFSLFWYRDPIFSLCWLGTAYKGLSWSCNPPASDCQVLVM